LAPRKADHAAGEVSPAIAPRLTGYECGGSRGHGRQDLLKIVACKMVQEQRRKAEVM
jgi:hypothetical protein